MTKSTNKLVTKDDGVQVLRGDLFIKLRFDTDLALKLLEGKNKWKSDKHDIVTKELDRFNCWYTVRLRDLNGPTANEVRKKKQALAGVLFKTSEQIGLFLKDKDMTRLLAAKLIEAKLGIDIKGLKTLGRQAGNYSKLVHQITSSIKTLRGRQSADYRRQAAAEIMQIWEKFTENPFPQTFEISDKVSDLQGNKLQFRSPALQFLYYILRSFEPRLTTHDVRHAVEAVKKLKLHPK